jgi:hypothetical protein
MPKINPNPMEIPMKTEVELCELILADQADNVASLRSHAEHVSAKLAEAKDKVATLTDKHKQIAIDAALDKAGARDTLAAVNDERRGAEIDVEALSTRSHHLPRCNLRGYLRPPNKHIQKGSTIKKKLPASN